MKPVASSEISSETYSNEASEDRVWEDKSGTSCVPRLTGNVRLMTMLAFTPLVPGLISPSFDNDGGQGWFSCLNNSAKCPPHVWHALYSLAKSAKSHFVVQNPKTSLLNYDGKWLCW